MSARTGWRHPLLAGALSLSVLSGCGSVLPEVTPFKPVVETFDGRYIDTLSADIEAARGPEEGGLESKALNDLEISQGLATMNIAGLVDAPEMLTYMRTILARVIGVYPYDKPAMELYIDASDRGTAQATPNAEIYIGLGLLQRLETEGQLAMILAHEAAHILLNHFSRQDYIDAQRKTVTASAGIAMLGSAAKNTDVKNGAVQHDSQDTATETAKLQTASFLINRISDHVVNNLWSRKQEEAADLLAADLLIKSGYNPRAGADLFRLLVELRAEEGTYLEFLKKQQEIAFRELGESESAVVFASNAMKTAASVIGSGAKEAWRRMGGSHIDPAKRQERMNTYRKREYQKVKFGKAERDSERTRLANAMQQKLPPAVLEGHRAANEATTALIERRLQDAETLAKKGISGPTASSAHTRTVMAMVRDAQRRYDESLLNLRKISPNELRPRQSFELEMKLLLQKREYDQALAVTEKAKRQYGTDEPFRPLRIQIELARGDLDQAWVEHDLCKEEVLSTNIRRECTAVMKNQKRPGSDAGAILKDKGGSLFDGLGSLIPDI